MFWNTILFDVTSYWRCQHSTWSRVYVTVESPSVCLSVRLYVPSIASTQVNSALHPSRVAKSSTSFGWGKGGNVTSVGLQVTLCDPIWHVSSRSGVATLRTAIHLLLTYLLTYQRRPAGLLPSCRDIDISCPPVGAVLQACRCSAANPSSVVTKEAQLRLHRQSKKQDTKLLPITSPNINRFSKFFHC